jgi:hypothetical protein
MRVVLGRRGRGKRDQSHVRQGRMWRYRSCGRRARHGKSRGHQVCAWHVQRRGHRAAEVGKIGEDVTVKGQAVGPSASVLWEV